MFKKMVAICLVLLTPVVLSAQVNPVRIVALVITTTDYSPSSDNIMSALNTLNAQTLRAESPNASELRSLVKRFAAAALDNDIALVFADGPILKLGERDFLAPANIELRRGSDLLTQAIPISALARAAALAGNGGAIFVHSGDLGMSLPEGISLSQIAPDFRAGTSPILMGKSGSAMAMAYTFEQYTQNQEMDLSALLLDLATAAEFTVSYIPERPVILKRASVPTTLEIPMIVTDAAQPSALPQIDDSIATTGADVATPVDEDTSQTNNAVEPDATLQSGGLNLPQVPAVIVEEAVAPEADAAPEAEEPLSLDRLEAIQSGLSRADKREIQRWLRALGFYSGLIDGIFGNQTKFAIEKFQQSIDAEVTGILSPVQMENIEH